MALGTLSLLDTEPRTLTARDVLLLEKLAGEVMAAVREQRGRQRTDASDGQPALAAG